jgi:CelD/BcsL family acetyltransferase involved in cellulose biosynthesis
MSRDLQVRVHAGTFPGELAELADSPAGSFFQTPAWLRAVQRAEARLEPLVLAVEGEGGLQAALPLFGVRRYGTLRLYAGAWGTYGGIVARTAEAAARTRAAFESWVRRPRVVLARVHDFGGSLQTAAGSDLWRESEEVCQVLDLPLDSETLFRDAFTSQNRNKIRKAEKLGVQVRRAHDRAALASYAEMYGESAARWGLVRPLGPEFFLELADAAGVDVWLAERDGETLAGLLNFTCGGQIMNWGNVSRRDAWGVSPNNLLHWRALQAACADARGPRLYNFGSSTGLPGVETFKAAFGARQHFYTRREHVPGWMSWWRRRGSAARTPF